MDAGVARSVRSSVPRRVDPTKATAERAGEALCTGSSRVSRSQPRDLWPRRGLGGVFNVGLRQGLTHVFVFFKASRPAWVMDRGSVDRIIGEAARTNPGGLGRDSIERALSAIQKPPSGGMSTP